MDIDISDILADVSRESQGRNVGTASELDQYAIYDAEAAFTDHQQLVRSWTLERCAPDLLPYQTALIERTMGRIRAQIARIEDLTSGVGDASSHGTLGHVNKLASSQNVNLTLSILQTDLSRAQFLVRSYLRQRLAKITKYAMFYLTKHLDQDTKSTSDLLSPAEVQFLRSHQSLLNKFYDDSFLSGFPAALKRLDDSSGGVSMVEGPDSAQGVVVRCLAEDGWNNEAEMFGDRDNTQDADMPTVELRMARSQVWVVRWRDVKPGVLSGDLEML